MPEFEADKERLASGEPLAYVIGYQPFLGLKIYLDSKPLIPRPETEWWTEQLLDALQGAQAQSHEELSETDESRASKFVATKYASPKGAVPVRPLTFLDLCAGSGAIGCAALKALPNAHVYFGEIDPAHESTILKNIRENNLDASRAHVCIGDLFSPFGDTQFNIIAANPPYIPSDRTLDASVADYEPSLALFSGSDGLDHIRRIAKVLPRYLAPGGIAWIECSSLHSEEAQSLFEHQSLHAEIRTDQYGAPRIIVVSLPHAH